jgi:hypothetical protein
MAKLRVSDTCDYLLKEGRPFFYLADTVWAAFANLSLETWERYLRYRRAQGFNAVQISILPITHDTSTSEASVQPFLPNAEGNWDPYRLNEAYFHKAEEMVAMASDAGVLPVLGVVWKCHVPGTLASRRSPVPSALPEDAMEGYVAHVVKRFARFAPVYFISGDTAWDSDQEPIYYMSALDIVRSLSPDSLITMHMVPNATLPDEFADRVDFYMYQSGHGPEQRTPYELARKHQHYATKRPVVNGEPCYEGHGKGRTLTRFSAFDVRKATWQSLLSGAKMGITYGAHGVWSCHSHGMDFVQPEWKFVPYDWEEALHLPGAWDVCYAKWLFEQYGLWDADPCNLLVRDNGEVAVSASTDHSKIAIYMPHVYDLALKLDLGGYLCQVIDLADRRPLVPEVHPGIPSTIHLSMCQGDALLVATR